MTREQARAVAHRRLRSAKSLRTIAAALIGTPGANEDDCLLAEQLNARAKVLDALTPERTKRLLHRSGRQPGGGTMTLAKARLASLARLRSPESLYRAASALLRGNERDQARAAEFIAKAKRIERAILDEPRPATSRDLR